MRRLIAGATGALLLLTVVTSSAFAGGPPGLAFYVDGERYRTLGTPIDFFDTGAPVSSFDEIYALGNGLINVAEAAPGDTDYNGGRWRVLPVTWTDPASAHQLYSAEQVYAAAAAGELTIAVTPAKEFLCPVIPVQGNS